MMENFLISLESLSVTGLCPSCTPFMMDMIFAIVCGLVLFLLLLPWLQGEPTLRPRRKKRNIRKHPVWMRWKKGRRKRTAGLLDYQIYKKLDKQLIPLLKSLQRLLPGQGGSQHPVYQHHPADAGTRAPVTAPQPDGKKADPATLSPVEAAPSPLTPHLLSLASSPSQGPSATSSDFVCSPTPLTASQTPEPLLLLGRLAPQPLSLSPPRPPACATTPPPCWDTNEMPEQQLGPQQPSCPKILGAHLQQKRTPIFCGLPSLHSESVTAAAGISQNPPVPHLPTLFNRIPPVCPVHTQDQMSPLLSLAQDPSCLEPRSPPQPQPPALGQAQTRTHPQSSSPILLAPSLPLIWGCGASCCSTSHNPQSPIATEIQPSGRPLSKKHLEHGWAVPSAVRSPQEGYCPSSPNLCQGKGAAAILHESFPISSELRENLEQHIRKWHVRRQQDLPCRIQESPELTQPQYDLARSPQVKDKPGLSHSSVSTGKLSEHVKKVRFQLREDSGKNVGHILGKVPKDLSRALGSSPGKVLGATSEESERNLMWPMDRDARNDSLRSRDKKHLEAVLKAHLGVKMGQIHEGLIPLRVRRSWLAVSGVIPTSHTHMETRNPASSRSRGPCVSTIQVFSDPCTQQYLEMQRTRHRVRHRWGLPLKLLKAVNTFKSTKAVPSPFPQCAHPSSSGGVSWADLRVEDEAKFLGKPPQGCCPGEEATVRQSVHALGSLLVSISCKIDRALAGIPLGDGRWSSEAPLTRQNSVGPSWQLTSSLMGRTCESKTTQRVGRGSPEVLLLPGTCVVQDAGEPGLWADTGSKFQHGVEIKSVSHCQVCATGVYLPDCPTDSLCASHRLASPESQSRHHSMPLGYMLAPQLSGDLMADRGSSLGQQKLQILKYQHSRKGQSKTSVPADKHEVGRSPSSGKHEDRLGDLETSEPTQDGGIEDTLESKHLQLPQKKPVPSEGDFQKSMKKGLQWVLPKKEIKRQEDSQKKGKPAPTTAQSQRPAKKILRVARNTEEVQQLLTALGQIVETTITLKHKLCALKFN